MAKTKETIPHIRLSGDPHERGLTHGTAFADEISENLETYLSVFEHNGADRGSVYDQADQFLSLIENENEEYFEEMKGVADGSRQSLEEIGILNARYEIMYSALAEATREDDEAATPTDGCTAFGAQPEITVDGRTYLGQNWDWIPSLHILVQNIEQSATDKPDMVTMTEAGIVGGKIGVNEHGIGMLLNGLVTSEDGKESDRKPYHVRFREVLNAERLDSAIAPLIEDPRACSANVMLGHAAGEIIDLELAPEDANYLYPEDGLLTHANHLEGDGDIQSDFEKLFPDTLCRAPRLRRLLRQDAGEIGPETIKEVLRDHFGKPQSICSHPDASKDELDRFQTNGSFIIDLEERSMLATEGPPCESDYHRFEVGA